MHVEAGVQASKEQRIRGRARTPSLEVAWVLFQVDGLQLCWCHVTRGEEGAADVGVTWLLPSPNLRIQSLGVCLWNTRALCLQNRRQRSRLYWRALETMYGTAVI